MAAGRHVPHRPDVGDDLGCALRVGIPAKGGVGGFGEAVAAMIMCIDVEAVIGHDFGEAGVTGGMFGQSMADDQHTHGLSTRWPMPQARAAPLGLCNVSTLANTP